MKAAVLAFAAAALLTGVGASVHDHALGHAHLHKKRDTTTVTEDGGCKVVWTTWYGEAGLVPEAAPSSTSTSTTSTPPATPASPSPKINVGSSSSSSSSSSGELNVFNKAASSNGALGMTYSPYDQSGCKSTDAINNDIQNVHNAGFNTVRIYATDCNQLAAVHQATQNLGMSMIIGIFLKQGSAQSDFNNDLGNITSYFQSQGAYSGVDLVVVGNEVISGGVASAGELSSYIQQARSSLRGSGYTGPVSTSLISGDWMANPSLCDDVDLYASNIHPFYSDNTVQPGGSGDYINSQIHLIQQACGNPNKAVVVTETGWPTVGSVRNGMTPSPDNQASAVKSMRDSGNATSIMFFSNSNDMWKASAGVPEWELYFGCLDQFGPTVPGD